MTIAGEGYSGVQVPMSAITDGPGVQWRHIDGPLMHWAGNIHWLTWRERLSLWLGFRTVDEVAAARWPHLSALASLQSKDTDDV